MKNQISNKRRLFCIISTLLALVCITALLVFPASAYSITDGNTMLRDNNDKCRSGLLNTVLGFDEEDFYNENGQSPAAIVIVELPDPASGALMVGHSQLLLFETVTADRFNKIQFVPTKDFSGTTYFCYRAVGENGTQSSAEKISISYAAAANISPTLSAAPLETQANIAVTGRLNGADPDGDPITYTVIRQPEKGLLDIAEDGIYRYTPMAGKAGSDKFTCIATDSFGNTSEEVTVQVTIAKATLPFTYTDMQGHYAHYAALKLAEHGVLQGEQLAGNYFFSPDETISRGDFLMMTMAISGLDQELPTVVNTGLNDDVTIPVWMKPYVRHAVTTGLVQGAAAEDGTRNMNVSAPITRAEAAVLLCNVLDPDAAVSALTMAGSQFADRETVPSWAASAIITLEEAGILQGGSGSNIRAHEELTRGEAAQLLWNLKQTMSPATNGGWFDWLF